MGPTALSVESHAVATGLFWLVVTALLHFVLPLSLTMLAFSRARFARAQARLADAQWVAGAPLREGRAVLHGTVELARGADTALRVEIRQVGTEHKGKHSFSHTWKEVDRTVVASPFYVEDVRGARVRVEPDDRTMLVDTVDRIAPIDRATRTRIAELSQGERVYVVGELRPGLDPEAPGGYREAATALVLGPPRRSPILVSTQPLGDRFRSAARVQERAAKLFAGALIALAVLDAPLYGRLFAGVPDVGVVTGTRGFSGKSQRCELTVRTADGWTFRDDAAYGWCRIARPGLQVPFIRVRGTRSFVQLGVEPGIHGFALFAGCVVFGILAALYAGRARPWYEDTLVERGTGRLP